MDIVEEKLRLFCANNLFLEESIREVEREYGIKILIGDNGKNAKELNDFYLQLESIFRQQAEVMSYAYKLLFCLENSIRNLISSVLEEEYDDDWWSKQVPQDVQQTANKNQKKEQNMGFSPRSAYLIDYVTFGELGQIIAANRAIFGSVFKEVRAAENILVTLNQMRAPIAHCNFIQPIEVTRLEVALQDWFRQME